MADRPIQNCQVRFQFKCPKQWDSLQETTEPGVRLCGQCHKQVYLCQSTQEAAEHARAGHCVAVPVGLVPPALERAELERAGYVEMGVMVCEEPPEADLFEGPVGKLIRSVLLDAHQKQVGRIQVELTDSGTVIRYGLEGSQQDAMWVPFQLRHEVMRQLRHASRGITAPEGQLHILMRGQRIDYQVRFNPTALGEEAVLHPLPES